MTPYEFNKKRGLALVCPATKQIKGYPYEVSLPAGVIDDKPSVILIDQMRMVDWRARHAVYKGKAPMSVVTQVMNRLRSFLI
ncbi:MAG: hypothetical protein GY862_37265 [Gammaproteobacteria bacterium]|nr:hypothetical protein [Gammaproteobacteria bacterium]